MDDGQPATELLDWNSPLVQRDLRTMAEMFLQKDNNCDRFWSPNRTWAQESDLKYPDHKERIINLLVQLFWKQNRYLYNNNQYGSKATGHPDSSREESALVRDLERQKKVSTSNGSHEVQRKRKSEYVVHADFYDERSSIQTSSSPPASKNSTEFNPSLSASPTQETRTDPFEIFEIPDDEYDNPQASARASVAARSSKLHRTTRRPADDTDAHKRKKPSKEKEPRRTGRKRHAVVMPGVFLGDEAEQVLDSAEAEEVAESLEMQQSWNQLRQDSNKIPGIEQQEAVTFPEDFVDAQLNQASSNGHLAAPTAPMISGGGPTQPEQHPSSERSSLKLRFKVPASKQFPRSNPQSPTSTSQTRSEILSTKIPATTAGGASIGGQVGENTTQPPARAKIKTTSAPAGPRRASTTNPNSDSATISPASMREGLEYQSPYVSLPMDSLEPPSSTTGTQNLDHTTKFKPLFDEQGGASSMTYTNQGHITLGNDIKKPRLPRDPSWSPDPPRANASERVTNTYRVTYEHPLLEMSIGSQALAEKYAIMKQDPPLPIVKSQAPSQSPAPVAKPKIQIPLWVILTRDPLYTEKQWNEGKFQGPPLSVFLEGLNKVTRRNNVEKIELTLRTPFSNTILTVENGAEDAWITAKATFGEKLKESRAEARMKRIDDTAGYKILIEPFYEQVDLMNGGAEAEEDVFDW